MICTRFFVQQRVDQRGAGQDRDDGERAVGERVLQAAPQHQRRAEDARHADGIRQPERRQQHQQLQERGDRPRIGRRRRAQRASPTIGTPSFSA